MWPTLQFNLNLTINLHRENGEKDEGDDVGSVVIGAAVGHRDVHRHGDDSCFTIAMRFRVDERTACS